MVTQLINQFTQFQLTEEEQLSGQQFNTLNLRMLQNHLADLCIEKVNLKYTPNDHLGWVQAEAELHGKIGMLTYLIESSAFATEIIIKGLNDTNSEGD